MSLGLHTDHRSKAGYLRTYHKSMVLQPHNLRIPLPNYPNKRGIIRHHNSSVSLEAFGRKRRNGDRIRIRLRTPPDPVSPNGESQKIPSPSSLFFPFPLVRCGKMRSEDHSSRKGRKKEVHPLLFPLQKKRRRKSQTYRQGIPQNERARILGKNPSKCGGPSTFPLGIQNGTINECGKCVAICCPRRRISLQPGGGGGGGEGRFLRRVT